MHFWHKDRFVDEGEAEGLTDVKVVTNEYYDRLVEGLSNGKRLVTLSDGYPGLAEPLVVDAVFENFVTMRNAESQLAATDYRIIKAYEYALLGRESPYDMAALHEEREKLRGIISECRTKPLPQ